MKPKSIILLSGGLDSTVSAAIAVKRTKVLFALTFDYCQRSARMEILAAKRIAWALKIKHKVIKLPFFKEFTRCHLIGRGKFQPPRLLKLKDVWVPNRNALFISIAACFAEYYKADLVVTGFNREEAQEFPDNSLDFIKSMNEVLNLSTLNRVKVISYVADYTKKEIYEIGLRMNAHLNLIYSCYLGKKRMCGRCASCQRLINLGFNFDYL